MLKIGMYAEPGVDTGCFQLPDTVRPPVMHFLKDVYVINGVIFHPDLQAIHPAYYKIFINWQSVVYGSPINLGQIRKMQCVEMDGPALVATHPQYGNYSHFTSFILGAMLLARDAGILSPSLPVLIDRDNHFLPPAFNLFKFEDCRFYPNQHGVIYRLKNAYVADASFGWNSHQGFHDLYAKGCSIPALETPKRLFITRRDAGSRQIGNQEEVEDFARSRGFQTCEFGNLSLAEQIAHIRNAEAIMAVHGGSGANLVFRGGREYFKFVEIFQSNYMTVCHMSLVREKNCDYSGVVFNAETSAQKTGGNGIHVDIGLLEEALRAPSHIFSASQQPSAPVSLRARGEACFLSGITDNAINWYPLKFAVKPKQCNPDPDPTPDERRALAALVESEFMDEKSLAERGLFNDLLYDYMRLRHEIRALFGRLECRLQVVNANDLLQTILKRWGLIGSESEARASEPVSLARLYDILKMRVQEHKRRDVKAGEFGSFDNLLFLYCISEDEDLTLAPKIMDLIADLRHSHLLLFIPPGVKAEGAPAHISLAFPRTTVCGDYQFNNPECFFSDAGLELEYGFVREILSFAARRFPEARSNS